MSTLVAGFGNVFFNDDGFGPAAVRYLLDAPELLVDGVAVRDFGIRGMHLALEMLEGYERVVLIDAIARDDPPGTLYVVEPEEAGPVQADAHAMDVRAVLGLYESLCRNIGVERRPQIRIVGCVPERTDEGMELSEPVLAALPRCAELVASLTREASQTGAVG